MLLKKLLKDDTVDTAIDKYSDTVYKLALSQTKSTSDAQDVFQEVYLRLFKSGTQFENEQHMKAWLIRTTINCCKSFFSCAWFRHRAPLDENLTTTPEYNESDLYIKVMELPVKYKIVIHLFYYEDMSIAQISNVLKIKKETIASQLSRGRSMLKEKLGGDYSYE